jgi:anaerobic ribonucleoside-triphosphate reductase activating protein
MAELQVAAQLAGTRAEGPGWRYAVWVQGCPLRCDGCCNAAMQEFSGGTAHDTAALAATIAATPGIEGLTLVGGEPFAQAAAGADLAERVRAAGLTVVVFSGYTLAELRGQVNDAERLLAATDLLIDGPYLAAQASHHRCWIGSDNQQVHFLSDRYHQLRDAWPSGSSLLLRVQVDGCTASGDPALVGAWKQRHG